MDHGTSRRSEPFSTAHFEINVPRSRLGGQISDENQMTPYLIVIATVIASHLCRLATCRGHAGFRFFDKPLAGLAVLGTMFLASNLGNAIEQTQWWTGGERNAVLNGVLFIGLTLFVIFVLLPPPYSNKRTPERPTDSKTPETPQSHH